MDLDAHVRDLLADDDRDAAATQVIETLGPAVVGLLRTLHDEDDADDVFQQWAEDVWRGLPGFRGDCSLRAWTHRLAWHASARFRRQPWLKRNRRLRTSAASKLAASVARSALAGRPEHRLEVLRKDLDPEERTLLLLRLDGEMTWEEISTVLAREGDEVTPVALRKRYQRIKDRLERIARDKGLLD